jgi:hypothetical protein
MCGISAKSLQSLDQLSIMLPNLRNNGDVRLRVDFVPLPMKRILYKSSDNTDVRTHGRQHNLVCVALTCGLSIRLCYWELADNLEH